MTLAGMKGTLELILAGGGSEWGVPRPDQPLILAMGRGRVGALGPSPERHFGLILGGGTPLPLRPIWIHLGESPPPSPNSPRWSNSRARSMSEGMKHVDIERHRSNSIVLGGSD